MEIVKLKLMTFLIQLMVNMLLVILGIIFKKDSLYLNRKIYYKYEQGLNIVIMIILQLLVVLLFHPYIVMMGCIEIFFIVMDFLFEKFIGLFKKGV